MNIKKVILPFTGRVLVIYNSGLTRVFSKSKCPQTVKDFIRSSQERVTDWATIYEVPEMLDDKYLI